MARQTRTMFEIMGLLANQHVGARRNVIWGASIEAMTLFAALAGPLMLKMAVDTLSESPAEIRLAITYVSLFVLFWASSAIAETVKLAFTDRIINLVAKHVTERAVRSQIAKMSSDSSIAAGHVHGLLERLTFSLQTIIEGLLWKVLPVAIEVAGAVALVAMLMPFKYAVVIAIVLLSFFVLSHFSAGQYEENADITNEASSKFSFILGDILNNSKRVMFNGALQQETDYISSIALRRVDVGWTRSWLLIKSAVFQYGLLTVGVGSLLLMGVADVGTGRITLGDFVLLQTYVFQFALPLGSFAFIFRQSGVALVNVREALDLFANDPPSRPFRHISISGPAAVEIQDVIFQRGNDFELSDVNLTLTPGSFITVVGPNGAGKSTLMKLIAGVLSPSEGMVKIGGINIHELPAEQRYKLALYVPQSVTLFDRTLRENACYFPSQLAEEEIVFELTKLKFHEDAEVNLDKEVGAAGDQLSGGQIQKLELVRISGVDSPVLVLDETTSGLDSKSEINAIEMLRGRVSCGTTLILITHRLLSVERADCVVFMQSGRIAATGTHQQLMSNSPAYKAFWLIASEQENLAPVF